MPHAAVNRKLANQIGRGKADKKVQQRSDQNDLITPQLQLVEAVEQQHRHDGGGKPHRFAARHARVAVHVGQHAGHTTQPASHQRRGEIEPRHRPGDRVAATDDAAEGDVCFEIGHDGAQLVAVDSRGEILGRNCCGGKVNADASS